MSRKKRTQIKLRQRLKRRKRLRKLRQKNLDIGEYLYDGRYIGPRRER